MTVSRSGIVAVVGRPNVGKSTLVNALVGEKVVIVSDKPQTTRRDIRAIWTRDDAQIVYTDTPGFHKPRTLLGKRLNGLVSDAVDGVDVVLMVVDASGGVGRGDAFVYRQQVAETPATRICAVNKADVVGHHRLVPQLAAAQAIGDWDEIVPVSAVAGQGLATLRDLLVERLPPGPALYPEGELTDQPLEARLAEFVREQALAVTREEVPHSVAVLIQELERDGDLTRVHADIVVERDSQKGILIGRGGATLKAIGTAARLEMEPLLDTKVFLDLRVKVLKEWQRDPKALDRLGY
jgi:GTP-binding protein Era